MIRDEMVDENKEKMNEKRIQENNQITNNYQFLPLKGVNMKSTIEEKNDIKNNEMEEDPRKKKK